MKKKKQTKNEENFQFSFAFHPSFKINNSFVSKDDLFFIFFVTSAHREYTSFQVQRISMPQWCPSSSSFSFSMKFTNTVNSFMAAFLRACLKSCDAKKGYIFFLFFFMILIFLSTVKFVRYKFIHEWTVL